LAAVGVDEDDADGAGIQALAACAALDGLDAGVRCWPVVEAHAASVVRVIANVVSAAISSMGATRHPREIRQMRRVALVLLCVDRIQIVSCL